MYGFAREVRIPGLVMAGLVPAIHVFLCGAAKAWMPATSAGMTN